MTENTEILFPKIHLAGSVHMQWKSCGRSNCRCARGRLHGPFFYRHWRDRGRQRKEYVPQENVAETLGAIAWRQALDREVVDIRKQLLWSIET